MHPQIYEDIYQAELTHWWFQARLQIVSSLIRRFSPGPAPRRIADIGCGMGASLERLARLGTVVGADFSPTALAFARSRTREPLVAAALPDLPFADGQFDVVCALDVIEHIDDDAAAVRELSRICRPGGLLVLTVPAYPWLWSEHDDINEHKRRYTRRRLQECLAPLPIDVLRLSYMNTLLAPPLMLARLIKRACKSRQAAQPEKSDVFAVAEPLNTLLRIVFAAEAAVLPYVCLPLGTSVIAIGRKRIGP